MEQRRTRGRPRVIDRERIVAAALEVGLENLTMRRVAEHLGVDPSALHYHVPNRDALLEAVASTVLEVAIDDRWTPPDDASWQEWVRAFAIELRRILRVHTPLALYFRFPTGPGAGGLEQFDRFLGSLYRAGFPEPVVAMATTYIAQMVFMSVRDEVLAAEGGHPQDIEFARKLDEVPAPELGNIRRLLAAGGHGDADAQFAFNVDCVVLALEGQLDRWRSR
ncbi:MAG TPA: TetR/AcrR family transcriptional regulator C-terminal domain-containing protein [Candidatus Dormibacteraeota bacterium]